MTRSEDPDKYALWTHAQRLWWQQPRKRAMLLVLLFLLVVVPIVYSQGGGGTVKEEVARQGTLNTYLLGLISVMMGFIGWFLKSLVADVRLVKEEYIRMNEVQRQQVKDIEDLENK